MCNLFHLLLCIFQKLQHEIIQAQQMALLLDDRLTENCQLAEHLQQFCKRLNIMLEFSDNFTQLF